MSSLTLAQSVEWVGIFLWKFTAAESDDQSPTHPPYFCFCFCFFFCFLFFVFCVLIFLFSFSNLTKAEVNS